MKYYRECMIVLSIVLVVWVGIDAIISAKACRDNGGVPVRSVGFGVECLGARP